MYFKPRIFISSTFTENKEIREEIKKYFRLIGGEPVLYEYNLTPSTLPLTYREDILEADFVILIIKENYGTKTHLGKSGTHEEYILARDNNIPMHVYVLDKENSYQIEKAEELEEVEKMINPLIKDITEDNISYFYYTSDEELMKRLKESTFTVAKEVMMHKIKHHNLEPQIVKKLAYNHDYKEALEIIEVIDEMKSFNRVRHFDFYRTTLFVSFMKPLITYYETKSDIFINQHLDEKLEKIILKAREFINPQGIDYTSIGTPKECYTKTLGKMLISDLSYHKSTSLNSENYQEILTDFFEAFSSFKELVSSTKMKADLL